jgi:hypothetical protein
MSFSSLVDFFILKKTSLLLSVTLILRCSVWGGASGRSAAGDPFSCCSDDILVKVVLEVGEDAVVDVDSEERDEAQKAELDEETDNHVSIHGHKRHVVEVHRGVAICFC